MQPPSQDWASLLPAAWSEARQILRKKCGSRTFESWLKSLMLADFDSKNKIIRLACPSEFMANWISSHLSDELLLAWRTVWPGIAEVKVSVRNPESQPLLLDVTEIELPLGDQPRILPKKTGKKKPSLPATAKNSTEKKNADGDGQGQFEERYNFDNFVVGKANDLAYRAACTFAEGGKLDFNPLFLYGGTGLGKTHLMHAVGIEYLKRHPNSSALYMSAEKFMYDFVASMRAKDTHSFKARLRSADLLMIDDVQFIAGKDSTQEEFFHTMNEVITAGRRLVISADRSPQDLERIESRILSRLSWGLVADVNPADFELRLNIILKKLEVMPQVSMPEEIVFFLAKRICTNVRELEGALNRVVAYATLSNRPINMDFVTETLADLLRTTQQRVTVEDIQKRVCDHYHLKIADMSSKRRDRVIARPRQVAMYLSKQLTSRSLPEIGQRFGGRDHTTVIHAIRQIEKLRITDEDVDSDVRLLMRQFEG